MTFFTYDDNEIPDDVVVVLEASAALEISEFDLFELAYRQWYGKNAAREFIEKVYSGYMFGNLVPPWVRQFCREVVDLYEQNRLKPEDYGIELPVYNETMARKGLRYTFFIALYMVALHLFAYLVTLD